MGQIHVVKRDTTWALTGAVTSTGHRTQQTAIRAARRKGNVGDEVYVHRVNGQIRTEFTIRGR